MTTKLPLINQDLPMQDGAADKSGPTWWKSLDERDATDAALAIQKDEFPLGVMPEGMVPADGTFADGGELELAEGEAGSLQRREMLKLMGASMALAGLGTGCIRRPDEKIVPYAKMPEHMIPGVPNFFASTLHTSNGAVGVLVESHEGRPTKIEGNPDHSMSKGAIDAVTQADILNIYDVDRQAQPLETGKASTWEAFDKVWSKKLQEWNGKGGKGVALFVDNRTSPSRERLLAGITKKLPGLRIVRWDALAQNNTTAGAEMVFGAGARVHTDLTNAKVIVALDSDFLASGPESVLHSKAFGNARNGFTIKSAADATKMNRLYAVEPTFSSTGASSDNRLRIASSEGAAFLQDLAAKVFKGAALPDAFGGAAAQAALGVKEGFKASNTKFLPALAKDLLANKGKAVVIVGERQPAAVHALAHMVNAALGAYASGIATPSSPFPAAGDKANAFFASMGKPAGESAEAPAEADAGAQEAGGTEGAAEASGESNASSFAGHWAFARPQAAKNTGVALQEAIDLMKKGAITDVVLLGTNPAATSPGAWGFADALKGKWVAHFGLLADEGSIGAKWHLPLAHDLESWGDGAAFDGTVSLVQPLIAPLLGGRMTLQVLAELAGEKKTNAYDVVRTTWIDDLGVVDDAGFKKALHDGVLPAQARRKVTLNGNKDAFEGYASAQMLKVASAAGSTIGKGLAAIKPASLSKGGIELVFVFDDKVEDGRGANNPWLQELPESMTKLCWDNALLLGPSLAKELGVNSKLDKNSYKADVVTVKTAEGSVDIAAFIMPGYAPYSAAIARGYGRTQGGEVATGIGVRVEGILPKDGSNVATGVTVSTTGKTHILASTQDHFSVDQKPFQDVEKISGQGERPIARSATLDEYKKDRNFAKKADVSAVAGGVLVQKIQDKDGHDTKEFFSTKNPTKPNRGIQMHDEVEGFDYSKGQQWGMVIDLNACTGCNACVVACQSENNIPSVGKDQILMGRELSWIRIDRYFRGDVNEPEGIHQMMLCHHCENAPCEPVCPVAATVHDTEGVNAMVYNRCIGTRYCANNCPSKVRRFNYFDFTATAHLYTEEKKDRRFDMYKMQRNPDVTVRFRGVMEKCTYCTQRIQEAKFVDKRNGGTGKNLKDGAVVPACQQTCAADAIVFGNINDPKSRVSQMKKNERNYELFSELNIRPRTTYLAKIKNPNPELVPAKAGT